MTGQQVYVIQHYEPRDIPDFYFDEFSAEKIDRMREPDWTGFHKIGISTDPEKRLSILRGGTPHRLRLVTTIDVEGDARQVERELHDLYGPIEYRRRNEWFRVPIDHIEQLKEIEVLHPGEIEEIRHVAIDAGDLSIAQAGVVNLLDELEEVRASAEGSA